MPKSLTLMPLEQLPAGESAEVVADGRIFAVYNVEGQVHVIDGICPHAGGPLGKGTLTGNVVTCPWHGWQFDVTNGQHCLSDPICQPSYKVEIVDGMVCVDVPE